MTGYAAAIEVQAPPVSPTDRVILGPCRCQGCGAPVAFVTVDAGSFLPVYGGWRRVLGTFPGTRIVSGFTHGPFCAPTIGGR